MLRILMLIGGAILLVLVAVSILHVLWWLMTFALILFVIGLAFGMFRVGRWSSRRR
jgi:hypothetical protein